MASQVPYQKLTDAMSTSDSNHVRLKKDNSNVASIAKSLLASLAEIRSSVARVKIARNNFLELGSYFHRVSQVIMELKTTEKAPENAVEALKCLSESTDLAKAILEKFQQSGETIKDHEVKTTIKQLGGLIKQMGEELSLIPPSTFRDEKYAETATCSLSEEMKRVHFGDNQAPETKLHMENRPKEGSTPTETDLYSISTLVCTENSHISDIAQIMEALKSASQRSQRGNGNVSERSWRSATEVARYVEPMYRSFLCPLTKQIMDDPVTIQSGMTYERRAITEYFERFENSEEIICPTTKEKLRSRAISPNIALKSIIQEWQDRNETARLKVIRATLSVGSTDSMILDALKDLHSICQRSPRKAKEVLELRLIPLLVKFLEFKDRAVRCAALELIRLLAEDDEGKELIGETPAIPGTIRLLSSGFQPIRHAALLLLIELSKSQSLAEKMGLVTGGILILVQTKYNRSTDSFASEAADQVLRNMEQCPNNIKLMAENGYLEPLLNILTKGSEERKLQMVDCLGEIILEDDSKTYVAKRTCPILIQMLQSGNPLTRKAVFEALAQISSHHPNGRILLESGIVHIMVEEMFTRESSSEQKNSLKEASSILANILESRVGLENIAIKNQGKTMTSGDVVFNIIHMIKSSTPDDINLNLVRILSCLTKSTKWPSTVASAIKDSEASYKVVELLNNPSDEIGIAAIKLLTLLSPHIGHLLIDRLCKTEGQPEGLILGPSDPFQITERQALSVSFLAELPHQNLTLNMALLSKNTIPDIIQSISQIQKGRTRQNSYVHVYLEGLVGILVRFTATLYDHQMLFLAIDHNFTAVLSDLLTETSSKVQRLAAIGLEKLSAQSTHLSKPPQRKRKKFLNLFYLPKSLFFSSSRKTKAELCPVHRGICSRQDTCCLIETRAVERLLACLDHHNVDVVEAALSTLSTLLDDKVDLEQSVNMLNEMNATQQVLKAVRHHKNESLWQKAFWIIERFLMIDRERSISLVSQDRLFSVSVVTAFHHGDAYTRQMAEKILRYLDKMPDPTGTFTT